MIDSSPDPDGLAPRRKGMLARLLPIAVLPALIGALIGTGALERLIPRDPYERATEEAGAELLSIPGFEERFGSLSDEEAFRESAELGASAIPLLPDTELGEWLTITRQLIHGLDVEPCASLVRGDGSADEALAGSRVLDIETYTRYLALMTNAVRMKLTDAPGAFPPSQAEADAASVLLAQELGLARAQEIGAVMADPLGASDADVCSAARDLYDALSELDEGTRGILLRMVTDPMARVVGGSHLG